MKPNPPPTTITVHHSNGEPCTLTLKDYLALRATGMLWEFHPDAPQQWPEETPPSPTPAIAAADALTKLQIARIINERDATQPAPHDAAMRADFSQLITTDEDVALLLAGDGAGRKAKEQALNRLLCQARDCAPSHVPSLAGGDSARLEYVMRYWDSQSTGLQPLGDVTLKPNPTGSFRDAIDQAIAQSGAPREGGK